MEIWITALGWLVLATFAFLAIVGIAVALVHPYTKHAKTGYGYDF